MDTTTLSAATDLRDMMVAHEVANRQLTALGKYLLETHYYHIFDKVSNK